MKKLDIKKIAGVGVVSLGLVVGVSGFAGASSGTIGTTGPDSINKVTHKSNVDMKVKNNNKLNLENTNHQHAGSGEVKVKGNTTGGAAKSGNAANANAVSATVEYNNAKAAAELKPVVNGAAVNNSASITNTGPDSVNKVKYESNMNVDIKNDNNVMIENKSMQTAHSGDAEVRHNTTGGDATSGNVSNTSSSSFTVRITN